MDSPETLKESLPPPIDKPGLLSMFIGRHACQNVLAKYPLSPNSPSLRDVISEMSDLLGDKQTVLPQFSYADVLLATGLAFVRPVSNVYIHVGDRSRKHWTDPELAH